MYTLGMVSSPQDERDYELKKVVSYASEPIQNVMVSYVPQPVDQGPYGVCVAVTLAGVIEAAEYKQRKSQVLISPKFIYGNRQTTDYQGEGMMPREALRMASKFGAPRRELLSGLSDYPTAKASITPAIDGEGFPNRIKGYIRLKTMQDVYDYFKLYDLPIVFGMWLTDSFMSTLSNGMVPAPTANTIGGHAMRGIGIRDGRLVVQNSWGQWWGDNWKAYIDISQHNGVEMWGIIPEKSETLINRPQEMMLTLGSKTLRTDNGTIEMDVAPFAKDNRTWVPLRFVTEALGADVKWYPMAGGRDIILIKWGGEQEK